MTNVLRAPVRMAVLFAVAAIGSLVLAASAMAVPSDPGVGPAIQTQAPSVVITWADSTPDPETTISGYQGGLVADPGATPADPVSSGISVPLASEGQFYFRVQAVQSDGALSGYATVPILVDRTGPVLGGLDVDGPLGKLGWYRAPLEITIGTCTDAGVGVSGAQCAARTWTEQGEFGAGDRSVTATDLLGNPSQTPIGVAFKYDNTRPTAAALTQPGALVPDEPAFRWFPGTDPLSGVDAYVLEFRLAEDSDGPFIRLAEVNDTGGSGEYTATRDPAERATPLPQNELIDWRVRTLDNAGNSRPSAIRQVTIDPTVPPAPSITGGPNGPTQNTTPSFAWEGTGESFRWDVVVAGTQNPIRSGSGTATSTQIQLPLQDGAYTFRVTQVTAAGRESAEAVRSFTVDTTPPPAPVILTRPTFPSVVTPVFTWGTEPGAYSRWSVLSGGAAVAGPTDTPVNSADLPSLADGAYAFQVQQIDAAGNVSPATVEPFTVIAPLVPDTGNQAIVTILPRQNAQRLQPKAGKTVMSRRPVLRWTRGPRGTKLFNLQLFRVTRAKGTTTPKVVKILSAFPTGRAYRVPLSKTRPKTCYVWRVWPYTGREFTPKPLGVSNFCVASQKVLTKTAKTIAARKAARARSSTRR